MWVLIRYDDEDNIEAVVGPFTSEQEGWDCADSLESPSEAFIETVQPLFNPASLVDA